VNVGAADVVLDRTAVLPAGRETIVQVKVSARRRHRARRAVQRYRAR